MKYFVYIKNKLPIVLEIIIINTKIESFLTTVSIYKKKSVVFVRNKNNFFNIIVISIKILFVIKFLK